MSSKIRRIFRVQRSRGLLRLGALCILVAAWPLLWAVPRVDLEVRERLQRDGRIHACVVLDDADPRADAPAGGIERRRTLQDLVVSRLEGAACRTRHRFRFERTSSGLGAEMVFDL